MATILIVEDELIDQRFLKRAFEAVGHDDVSLELVDNAEAAVAHLDRETAPDLVVSDLRMPGMGGEALVSHIKSRDDLKTIPTVVLSTADGKDIVRDCYERHANAYYVKPDSAAGYAGFVDILKKHWLDTVELPS